MNKEQIISQLFSLREYCGSMIDKDGADSVWVGDVEALSTAIVLACMIVSDDRKG